MWHCLRKFKVAYKISFVCGFCQNLEIGTFIVVGIWKISSLLTSYELQPPKIVLEST